jgi:hypothetical protein
MKQLAGWVLLGAIAVVALGLYGREQRARGRAEAHLVELRIKNDSLALAQRRVDTLYRVQRDTFYRYRDRLDTLTVTVERWMHDTVQVVRFVALADSTVRACSAALLTCEERDRLWAQRYANLEAQVAAMPKPRAEWKVWLERSLIAGASYKLGQATAPR